MEQEPALQVRCVKCRVRDDHGMSKTALDEERLQDNVDEEMVWNKTSMDNMSKH